jgi:hydrogenase maturation factor
MCLTVPRKVIKIKDGKALLQDGRWVKSLAGKLKPGDMVLAQADLAIEKITKNQAGEMKTVIYES